MRKVFFESDNEDALTKLGLQARQMQIAVIDESLQSVEHDQPVKVFTRADLEEIAGSLSDFNLDAAELRKRA